MPRKTQETSSGTPPPAAGEPVPSSSVQAVGMAFAVLEALAQTSEPVGTSELARQLGETKARVHRHLSTLRELGFVEQDPDSTAYRLGWKAYRLSTSVAENFGLRKLARRHLLRLHHESGQTAALTLPAGTQISVIDSIHSTGVAITVGTGSVIPAVSSALGRAILAFQSADDREAALAQPISPLTVETPVDARRVHMLLEEVRGRWWAAAVNERLPGVAALAAPIFDGRDRVIASVGVIGSLAVVTDPPTPALLRQVQDAAAAISAELRSTAWLARAGASVHRPAS